MKEKQVDRFWAKVKKDPCGCWLWQGAILNKGRGKVFQRGNVKIDGKNYQAHRVSFALEHGLALEEVPDLLMHSCDEGLCVRPDHLSEGTHEKNTADMHVKKRAANKGAKGIKNSHALLTDEDVVLIRGRLDNDETNKEIAKDYGVHHSTISAIRRRVTWTHVGDIAQ